MTNSPFIGGTRSTPAHGVKAHALAEAARSASTPTKPAAHRWHLDDKEHAAPSHSKRPLVARPARMDRQLRPGTRTKPIEAIEIGDMVWAWDEAAGSVVRRPVLRLFRHRGKPIIAVTVLGEDGAAQRIEATTEHPFWVAGKGWVAACELQPGDVLKRIDGGDCLRVTSAPPTGAKADVFNFEVAEIHNYFVGAAGVLVHNDSGMGNGASSTPRTRTDAALPRSPISTRNLAPNVEGGWKVAGAEKALQAKGTHATPFTEAELSHALTQSTAGRQTLNRFQRMGATVALHPTDSTSDLGFLTLPAGGGPPLREVNLVVDRITAQAAASHVAPARLAAEIFAHETDHLWFERSEFGKQMADTQYQEYRAMTKEALLRDGRRPTLAEKRKLWAVTQATYDDLPVGKYPFGRANAQTSFADVGNAVRHPDLGGKWRALEGLPIIDHIPVPGQRSVEVDGTVPFERSRLSFERAVDTPDSFVDLVHVSSADSGRVTVGQVYGERAEGRDYVSLSLDNRQPVNGQVVKFKPLGFGLTDVALAHGINAYAEKFGAPLPATEGSMSKTNIATFYREYAMAAQLLPDASAHQLATIAVQKTPFGAARVKAGYGAFSFPWGLDVATVSDVRGRTYQIPDPMLIRAERTAAARHTADPLPDLQAIDEGW